MFSKLFHYLDDQLYYLRTRIRKNSDSGEHLPSPVLYEINLMAQAQEIYFKGRGENLRPAEIRKWLYEKPDLLEELADQISTSVLASMQRKESKIVYNRRRRMKQFSLNHRDIWADGLDLLLAYLAAATEIGDGYHRYCSNMKSADNAYLLDVLFRQHARALQIGHEVFALLESGFADGAHARWRTAHEIAVITNFVNNHGNETARRFIDYLSVDTLNEQRGYLDHQDYLGLEPLEVEEIEGLRRTVAELKTKYGADFLKQYGWASHILGKKVTFRSIEDAVELSHLRPYYKMASNNVHGGPKGSYYRLGLLDQNEALLAGPSHYGLTDPAHGVALSILQTTEPFLERIATLDSAIHIRILEDFCERIGNEFLKIQLGLEEEASKDDSQ